MIPILDFSWQDFPTQLINQPKVGDLVLLCQDQQPRLFVAHDPVSRWCGVVVPDGVLALVDRLELPDDAPAFDIGLMGAVGQGQLTVRGNQPASTVAKLASVTNATCVIAVTEIEHPQGLFLPAVCAERLPRTSIVQNSSRFVQYVVGHAGSNLVEAIAALESEHQSFHSETINQNPADPYVCKEGGIDHYVPFCKHDPPHPTGPCNRGEWAL
jgi:hypothetical protein